MWAQAPLLSHLPLLIGPYLGYVSKRFLYNRITNCFLPRGLLLSDTFINGYCVLLIAGQMRQIRSTGCGTQ